MAGTWMQATAQGALVKDLTDSTAYLGLVSFAAGVPNIVLILSAGVIADRIPRRKLLMLVQSTMMFPAVMLAILTFTGLVQPWHILVLAVILGIANAFDGPARQAFLPELVEDRRDLTNAIALNAMMFNSAVVIGPAIGGLLYDWVGPGWCFTANSISFIAVIIALGLMHIQEQSQLATKQPRVSLNEMSVGVKFVLKNKEVLLITLSVGMASVFGVGMLAIMPSWADHILHGGAQTYGWILAMRGLGALSGSIAVASLGHIRHRGRLWAAGIFLLPAALLVFSFMRSIPTALFIMLFVGLGFVLTANTSNALVQSRIPDEMRGRVMAVYLWVFFGAFPLGSLQAGFLAEIIGQPLTVMLNSLVLLGYAAFIWLRFPLMRQLE
jgi:MFS family permease